jgi:hypothetical protein
MEPADLVRMTEEKKFVFLGSGVAAPEEMTVSSGNFGDFDTTIRIVYDDKTGRFIADEIRVRRIEDSKEVTSTDLRKIRVEEIIRTAVPYSVVFIDEQDNVTASGGYTSGLGMVPPSTVKAIKESGLTDDALMWVARVYTVAHAVRLPPAKAVSEALELPTRTASYWIAKARKLGLLE